MSVDYKEYPEEDDPAPFEFDEASIPPNEEMEGKRKRKRVKKNKRNSKRKHRTSKRGMRRKTHRAKRHRSKK